MFHNRIGRYGLWDHNFEMPFVNVPSALKDPITKRVNVAGFNKNNLDLSYKHSDEGLVIVIDGKNEDLDLTMEKEVIIPYTNIKVDSAKVVDGLLILEFSPSETLNKKIPIE